MSWFADICRNMGLMVHNIKHPQGDTRRQVVKKDVQEEKRGHMTLRRTTIEEIEIRRDKQEP